MAGRNYTELKKIYCKEDFDNLSRRVTETYARSLSEYSQTQLARDFNITVSCARKLIDYAIEYAIVSKKMSDYVLEKAIKTQQRNHPQAGGSSIEHHKKLIRMREEHIATSFPELRIAEIVSYYIENNFEDVAKKFGLESNRVGVLLIERAIVTVLP